MAQVVLADPGSAGLAAMLAGLLEAAIADPAKARLLDAMSGTVTIAVPDAEVEVGLRFGQGTCRVHAGPIPGATVRITTPSDALFELSTVPLLFGLPSPFAPAGRAVLRQLASGTMRIRGLRHLTLVRQINTLLSLG